MNKTLLPKLRFPEFQDEWDIEKLGNISMFVNERVSLEKLSLDTYISTENILPDYEGVTKASKLPPSGSAIQYKKDDVLISNIRPYLKKVWFSNKDGGASNDVIIVRAKEKITARYLSLMLRNDVFIEYVMNGAKGVKMPRGDISLMKKYPLAYPSPAEQQKIADCLTALDDLIAAQSQKVAALQAYKKGLMQNLFPAEGESAPRLRFPEFESAGEWETAILGTMYSFKSTNSFSRDQLNYISGSAKNIHYGDIHTKFSTLFDVTKERVPYINPSQSIETIKMDSYCIEGDMIFADASEDLNDVGKSIEIVNLNDEKIVSGMHTILARQIMPKLAIGFGGYLFKSERIRTQIKKEAQGAKVLGISSGRLSRIEICFPSNKKEQQRIVHLLTAIDEEISAQGEALAALKVHKRGLMQGLFPKQASEVLETSEV